MQSLAAYSFEASVTDPMGRLREVELLLDKWLIQKGADNPRASDGSFVSRSGDGTGQFARRTIAATMGVTLEVELIETAHTGAMFTTAVQIAQASNVVSVFVSLAATPGESIVAPVKLYPRCPWIVRALVEGFSDWRFAGQELPVGRPFDATNDGSVAALCRALRATTRRLPIVVISIDQDEQVWGDLADRAAEQLIGLADVAVVDAESSWLLTDELGPQDSCYLGAVRLYWPVQRNDRSFEGITWLASRLASFGSSETGRNKFLSILRRTVMSTAALTMVQSGDFRAIQGAATKERLQALAGQERDRELDSIIEENAKLMAELEQAKQTIASLQWKLAASAYAERIDAAANDDDEAAPEAGTERTSPQPGDVRYYKKIGSGGGIDSLVETKACPHKSSNWKSAHKGDQAEKGLLKLEGRDDWQSIAHCSACTGGGRWRVHW